MAPPLWLVQRKFYVAVVSRPVSNVSHIRKSKNCKPLLRGAARHVALINPFVILGLFADEFAMCVKGEQRVSPTRSNMSAMARNITRQKG